MTDNTTIPTEHTIYLGQSKTETIIRAAISVIAFVALMALFLPNPADNIPFLALLALAFASMEVGLAIHRRNNNTVTFRLKDRELVINEKVYKFSDLTLELSTMYAPSLLMVAGSRKFVALRPAWNTSNKKVREWAETDLTVLKKFINTVGDSEQKAVFQNAWLPIAEGTSMNESSDSDEEKPAGPTSQDS